MLKKLADRFPTATAKGSAMFESISHSIASPNATSSAEPKSSEEQVHEDGSRAHHGEEEEEKQEKDEESSPPDAKKVDGGEVGDRVRRMSLEERTASMRAALAERLNQDSMTHVAAVARTSMFGFMKKAQEVATVAAREGAAKATVLKSKAMDMADMDALQKRLSYALDRSTGDVNIDLLNFSFVTDNIVAMGFPSMNTGVHRTFIKDNPIDLVAGYLNEKHAGHYMIYNLSEKTYDYAYFDNQVLEFNFPGHPAPPLGLMFKICSSIENWLEADEKNIAAIHCLTGKGRTGTVIACYLAWVGQFANATEALEFVAERRNTTSDKLTIPSQRRYVQYFTHVMDGVKPHSSPLLLRRVIMNAIPVFGTRTTFEAVEVAHEGDAVDSDSNAIADADGTPAAESSATTTEPELKEVVQKGCCPYLQIFKNGKLVFTTTWRDMENGNGVQWASTNDLSISFNVNCLLQGDILIRCRHLTDTGERLSMFRGAFHTGYVPQGILRLTKAQLDGACGDDRFDQDFFIDLIFADVETEGGAEAQTPQSEGVALTAEDKQAYEDMLHRDEAFWVDIEARKQRLQKKREEQLRKKQELEAIRAAEEAAAAAKALAEAEQARKAAEEQKQKEAAAKTSFSIGGGDDDGKGVQPINRRGSWTEEKDKALMSELESLTSGALAQAAENLEEKPPAAAKAGEEDADAMAGLAKDFEDMKKLEQELGLESLSSELASLPHDNLSPSHLDLIDAELQKASASSDVAQANIKSGQGLDPDVMNFNADDFDELEEYLSGLSGSKS